jgi:hypothetical protein
VSYIPNALFFLADISLPVAFFPPLSSVNSPPIILSPDNNDDIYLKKITTYGLQNLSVYYYGTSQKGISTK